MPRRPVTVGGWPADQLRAASVVTGGEHIHYITPPSTPFTLPRRGAVTIDGGLGSICCGAALLCFSKSCCRSPSPPPPPPLLLWSSGCRPPTSQPPLWFQLDWIMHPMWAKCSTIVCLKQRATTLTASFSESEPGKTLQWGTRMAVMKVASHRAIVVTRCHVVVVLEGAARALMQVDLWPQRQSKGCIWGSVFPFAPPLLPLWGEMMLEVEASLSAPSRKVIHHRSWVAPWQQLIQMKICCFFLLLHVMYTY